MAERVADRPQRVRIARVTVDGLRWGVFFSLWTSAASLRNKKKEQEQDQEQDEMSRLGRAGAPTRKEWKLLLFLLLLLLLLLFAPCRIPGPAKQKVQEVKQELRGAERFETLGPASGKAFIGRAATPCCTMQTVVAAI